MNPNQDPNPPPAPPAGPLPAGPPPPVDGGPVYMPPDIYPIVPDAKMPAEPAVPSDPPSPAPGPSQLTSPPELGKSKVGRLTESWKSIASTILLLILAPV